MANSLPADPEAFYAQPPAPGFNYITTRDGTKLSAYVTLPWRRSHEEARRSDERESPFAEAHAPRGRCCTHASR